MSSEPGMLKHVESEKNTVSPDDFEEKADLGSFDAADGDEALQLVGMEAKEHFSEEFNRKLRRKLDFVIPTISAAVYFTQFLDKTALNYASVMGFPIVGQQYNLVSMAFYLGFLFWEFPTVYISQKLRLAKYLGANIVLWGALLMLHASTNNFGAFFALRFLLGMCESCVAPSLILIVSMFYKKDEQATRISWFYVMNGLTQVFGGFIAYGISFYGGKVIPTYKILYLLLGALAIIVGIIVLIWLPDSPVHARMLSKEERIAALERVRNDQGGTENKMIKMDQIKEALTDIRTWLVVLSTVLTSIPNGALSNFGNIIIKNFGYTTKQTLILSTPGGAIGSAMVLFCGWYSDKKNERMTPIVIALVPTIVGAAMMIGLQGTGQKGVLLFASYLTGTFGSALSTIYAYNASNTSGHTKKVTINAMTLATFSVGNIIGTEILQPKDAPGYIPGKTAIMVILIVQICVSFLLRWINIRLNKQRQKKLAEEKTRRGWSDADVQRERERHAFADLTDKQNLFFVYTA
ncbi:MFS general substrate transporter [Boletus edulis]|uniref:MFS general substrate transporter n=1 Tax=Boletus edulis BED1 TaxID=1328754 RepID=A0AAD4C7N6_BOLED|nr:MFS general substrate transporter [Boletus edulis]KAF8450432.1 MFS general substrate transporter [Boletus edulis BED1]